MTALRTYTSVACDDERVGIWIGLAALLGGVAFGRGLDWALDAWDRYRARRRWDALKRRVAQQREGARLTAGS